MHGTCHTRAAKQQGYETNKGQKPGQVTEGAAGVFLLRLNRGIIKIILLQDRFYLS